MRITVLGGCGAWPAAGQACSGYLVEHDGFRLLVDPGYATLPRLLEHTGADDVDAVLVSHGHPDHCADLNPLLRARTFRDAPPPASALAIFTPPGAVDPVLALDQGRALADAYRLHDFTPGGRLEVGPFLVGTWALPHYVPNAGLRLEAGGRVLAYTGDTGPSPDLAHLARDADVFLAEASYAEHVPADAAPYMSSARQAGQNAAKAAVRRLVLTHLLPGSDPDAVEDAARRSYSGEIAVARPGSTLDIA
ncbi:MBL fold metallo-hydrolase [Sphaerisporangium dianthi]|uniref:MBL fold metallo-hydrolase n=1 Tax=Sphaerisporangium dianthi TaxID=1436120 RepID=A0ABV9CK14_9ACTN